MGKTGEVAFKNFTYLLFSNVIVKIGSLITIIYTANILGPENFGKLNFAATFLTYFSALADFAISLISARDIAQNKKQADEIISSTISSKILLSIISFALLTTSVFLINRDIMSKKLIILYGFTIFSSVTFNLGWFFQGIEEMKYLGYSLILQSLSYVILIFIFIKTHNDIYYIPIMILVSQSMACLFQFFKAKEILLNYKFKFIISDFIKNIQKSAPVFISHIMLIITQNTPIIFIGFFLSDAAVGFFTSSQKISLLIWEVTCQYLLVIFPPMSKYYKTDLEKFNKIINYSIKFLFVLLMPVFVFIAIFSYSITEFIYGNKFIPSYLTLKILIFLPIFMFLDNLFTYILISVHKQKLVSKTKTISTILMIIALFFITGKTGINTVAIIILFFSFLNFIAQYFLARDMLKIDFLNSVLKPVFYSTITGFVIFYLKNYNLVAACILSFAFYLFMVYYFKTFNAEEIVFIKSNFKTIKNKIENLYVQS